jgi:Cu/Ag efflux pump CusA
MKLDVAYDSSTFIQDSIDEVSHTIIIAMCLVVLVILLFLKSFRATLIPSVAIGLDRGSARSRLPPATRSTSSRSSHSCWPLA